MNAVDLTFAFPMNRRIWCFPDSLIVPARAGTQQPIPLFANEKTSVDSRAPQLHYPQGSFSDKPGPQLIRHRGSLGRAFALASLVTILFRQCFCMLAQKRVVVEDTIRPPFTLTLFSGFLTLMRKPLGTLDYLSRVYRLLAR
jgi:hypothetical protein